MSTLLKDAERVARRIAKEIAKEANGCCDRSDGYEEDIEQFAYERIRSALIDAGEGML